MPAEDVDVAVSREGAATQAQLPWYVWAWNQRRGIAFGLGVVLPIVCAVVPPAWHGPCEAVNGALRQVSIPGQP